MATLVKTPSGTWKALIRKTGWPTIAKTFRTKRDAEAPRPNVSKTDALDVLLPRSWLAGDEPRADVKFPGASHQRPFAS